MCESHVLTAARATETSTPRGATGWRRVDCLLICFRIRRALLSVQHDRLDADSGEAIGGSEGAITGTHRSVIAAVAFACVSHA